MLYLLLEYVILFIVSIAFIGKKHKTINIAIISLLYVLIANCNKFLLSLLQTYYPTLPNGEIMVYVGSCVLFFIVLLLIGPIYHIEFIKEKPAKEKQTKQTPKKQQAQPKTQEEKVPQEQTKTVVAQSKEKPQETPNELVETPKEPEIVKQPEKKEETESIDYFAENVQPVEEKLEEAKETVAELEKEEIVEKQVEAKKEVEPSLYNIDFIPSNVKKEEVEEQKPVQEPVVNEPVEEKPQDQFSIFRALGQESEVSDDFHLFTVENDSSWDLGKNEMTEAEEIQPEEPQVSIEEQVKAINFDVVSDDDFQTEQVVEEIIEDVEEQLSDDDKEIIQSVKDLVASGKISEAKKVLKMLLYFNDNEAMIKAAGRLLKEIEQGGK